MSSIRITIPDSLHQAAIELAKKDKISISQFIAIAMAEKISALKTASYLEEGAKRGNREKFLKVLEKVSDVEPEEYDCL
jgi:post-segregation antitoxin (ccd killing protein)